MSSEETIPVVAPEDDEEPVTAEAPVEPVDPAKKAELEKIRTADTTELEGVAEEVAQTLSK